MINRFVIFKNRQNLQKIVSNVGWLFIDKILFMGIGFFLWVWIARYLGPEQYGLWNYAIALTLLFSAFATLGLDSIVIRDIVNEPSKRDAILGSAFFLKLFGGIFAFLITVGIAYIIKNGDKIFLYLVALSALGFVFQSIDVIDFYFQSQVKSKYTVISRNSAFVLSAAIKIILLINHASLIAFAMVGLVEIVLSSFFMLIAYRCKHLFLKSWSYSAEVARKLLKDSWPVIFSGIAIMIYMRIDQIMIGELLGNKQVGIYSAAVRISEIWYFIPMVIVGSVFPAIIESKKRSEKLYYTRLQQLYDMMAFLGVVVAIAFTFLSKYIINSFYGASYAGSTSVLTIHAWAGVFVCLGVASGKWLLVENLQRYGCYKALMGGIVNIFMNFILIPRYGINGAAIATVISQGVSVCSVIFFKRTRSVFYMMLKAFIFTKLARKYNV